MGNFKVSSYLVLEGAYIFLVCCLVIKAEIFLLRFRKTFLFLVFTKSFTAGIYIGYFSLKIFFSLKAAFLLLFVYREVFCYEGKKILKLLNLICLMKWMGNCSRIHMFSTVSKINYLHSHVLFFHL